MFLRACTNVTDRGGICGRGGGARTRFRAVISALIALTGYTVDASAFPRSPSAGLAGGAANCRQICVPPVGNCKNHSLHRQACGPCITSTSRVRGTPHLLMVPIGHLWRFSDAVELPTRILG